MAALSPDPRWADIEVGDTIQGSPRLLDAADVVLQISGSQDWDAIHFDPVHARRSGHHRVFLNSTWTGATLVRPVTDWVGAAGRLRRFEFQMRAMISPGDIVTARGIVTGKRARSDGRGLVDLELSLHTDRLGATASGTAVVELSDVLARSLGPTSGT